MKISKAYAGFLKQIAKENAKRRGYYNRRQEKDFLESAARARGDRKEYLLRMARYHHRLASKNFRMGR